MNFYNLNDRNQVLSFEEATLKGQGNAKGLFFPENIPTLPENFFSNLDRFSKEEIGFIVMKPYVHESISDDALRKIINETIDFPFPLMRIKKDIFALELFQGPTLAFKDVGARFMSRCLGHFSRNRDRKTTVLVATSGDTGGAVANGFDGVENVEVVILYPTGKVSPVQELQLTTGGDNITALEIAGSFDDCQSLVKQAFADEELNERLSLTSANSINVARWLPQQMYYFFAHKSWTKENAESPVVSVPSGNFGNICSGLLAHLSGLPVRHFIAACNANDTIPRYLDSGEYSPKAPIATLSNAMDVSDPSNFVRIMEMFKQQMPALKEKLTSVTISDADTKETIQKVYSKSHYLLDPHGAVAYYALENYLQHFTGNNGYILETAHPIKFANIIQDELHIEVQTPHRIKDIFAKEKNSIKLEPDFETFRDFLMAKN